MRIGSILRTVSAAPVPDPANVPVRDEPYGAVAAAQAGDPQADFFDHAADVRRLVSDGDVVADAVLVLGQDEEAGEEVLHQRLGAEAECDADDAGPGDERAAVEAEPPGHEQA